MKVSSAVMPIACLALAVASTPSLAGPGNGTDAHTIRVGTLNRTYYLHAPLHAPRDKPMALVLVFHGGGGRPRFTERETRFSDLADREGFLVAFPEGIGESWNDGRNVTTIRAQRERIDDVAFVNALLDDVSRDYPVDPKRIYATGISNGAIFSHYLAAHLSRRIAAIAPVAGGLPELLSPAFGPEQPVSVLMLQGTEDPLVPYNGGDVTPPGAGKRGRILSTDEAVRTWVERNGCWPEATVEALPDNDPADGCRVKTFTYSKGTNGTEVVLCRIEGGGHIWPNGSQYLPKMLVGRVCHDIDGTAVIWEFFKSHPKP